MEQRLQAPRRLLPRCSGACESPRRCQEKEFHASGAQGKRCLPSFLVTAQLKRKPTLPISQSCCRCSEALIIPKRSLVGLHVPPRNGFVFISLLKIFSVRLDVKNPSLSCIDGVRGTGSCRHSPHCVGSSGDINIHAYTASIKVMSQEQTGFSVQD